MKRIKIVIKYILSYFLLQIGMTVFAQEQIPNSDNSVFLSNNSTFLKDTVVNEYVVFDYFRQQFDSMVYFVGGYIIPIDSAMLNGLNEYQIEVIDPLNGYLKIYFRDKLLYKYSLVNNSITGTGICYFHATEDVAVQGQFLKGKLHGLVFVQNENGKVLRVMKFRKGKYVKHIYHLLSFSKSALRSRSKKINGNPLRSYGEITR